jgi:hypothetical protein
MISASNAEAELDDPARRAEHHRGHDHEHVHQCQQYEQACGQGGRVGRLVAAVAAGRQVQRETDRARGERAHPVADQADHAWRLQRPDETSGEQQDGRARGGESVAARQLVLRHGAGRFTGRTRRHDGRIPVHAVCQPSAGVSGPHG